MQGRIGILKVHARDKELEEDIDFHKVARATAGSTGAELMNLMNQSAIVTVRQGRKKIAEADIFEVCCNSCSSQRHDAAHKCKHNGRNVQPLHCCHLLFHLHCRVWVGWRASVCNTQAQPSR